MKPVPNPLSESRTLPELRILGTFLCASVITADCCIYKTFLVGNIGHNRALTVWLAFGHVPNVIFASCLVVESLRCGLFQNKCACGCVILLSRRQRVHKFMAAGSSGERAEGQ